MMFKRYGLDHYSINKSTISFLKICKKENLYVYHVKAKENLTYFEARLKDREKIISIFPTSHYLFTSGFVGMLFRNFTSKSRLLSYGICIFMWCFLSCTVFRIDVLGTKDDLDNRITQSLRKYQYQTKNIHGVKKDLLSKYKNDVSWLEVYDKGSIVKVHYVAKEKSEEKEFGDKPLIAKKDGMIAFFKSDAGFKVRRVNDIVKKGDILIDNHMPDSYQRDTNVEVRGKVYAHTWQKVSVEMKANKLPDAINYYSLLLEARNQVNIDLENEEEVEVENILQFSKNKGKIKLEILYTLLEDITS